MASDQWETEILAFPANPPELVGIDDADDDISLPPNFTEDPVAPEKDESER